MNASPTSIIGNHLFEQLAPEIVAQAAVHMRNVIFPAGEVIFQQGDLGNCLYLIMAGSVRISIRGREGKQETLVVIPSNDFFGEMALIDRSPRSATATAAEPCLLAALDQDGFDEIMRLAPGELAMNFIRAIVGRLRQSNANFVEEMLRNERLSLVGRMSSTIIHDFKNPMATISAACQMIERKATDPQMGRFTGAIERSLQQMLGMTQELLEFSRGETQLHPEAVPVATLVSWLDEQSLLRLEERGIKVEREIAFGGDVFVDPHRFVRVLLNIAKNAGEAMPKGGTLRVAVRPEAPWLVWEISDTGCGIPSAVLARIFEPFVTHGKSGGTGLGMTIAKTVAEAHGGDIAIESHEGVGTKTTVRIPLAVPAEMPATASASAAISAA